MESVFQSKEDPNGKEDEENEDCDLIKSGKWFSRFLFFFFLFFFVFLFFVSVSVSVYNLNIKYKIII